MVLILYIILVGVFALGFYLGTITKITRMKKINIVELLKSCPKGMELDCTMYEDCKFLDIEKISGNYLIRITAPCGIKYFDKYGCYTTDNNAKCVIFPKGKTTWEGFVPPCKFKDGDILVHSQNQRFIMSIYHKKITELIITTHCVLWDKEEGLSINKQICCYPDNTRFATEEEKQKLFDAIKANGYKWNAETKTLEKLIVPKFKVGDRVKDENNFTYTVLSIEGWGYILDDLHRTGVSFDDQDKYELLPNKFDITTLVPFESRVLVRSSMDGLWKPAVFGFRNGYNDNAFYIVGGSCWKQCIPYLNNEHLCGTNNDCDEYYKTWE